MNRTSSSRFLQGLISGAVATLLIILFMQYQPAAELRALSDLPRWRDIWDWIYTNLGMSIPVFGVLLCLYFNTLRKLGVALANNEPVERIAQLDHLLDTWTSLFFGVGVIWTAIGMRAALVFALGEPEVSLSLGAYAILERMVQGGILLALSTTIVGGIGGYLLRVVKTLTVESEIKKYYDRMVHAPGVKLQSTLDSIERHVSQLTPENLDNRA